MNRDHEKAREVRMSWLEAYDVELTRSSSMGLDDRIASALAQAREDAYEHAALLLESRIENASISQDTDNVLRNGARDIRALKSAPKGTP